MKDNTERIKRRAGRWRFAGAALVFMCPVAYAQVQERPPQDKPVFSQLPLLQAQNFPTQPQQSAVAPGAPPIPDPTLLTSKAVAELKIQLLELFEAKLEDIRRQLDRHTILLDRNPEALSKAIDDLSMLMDEKFKGVDEQFAGRDVALSAALLAQKTSVDEQNKANAATAAKAESGFTKQLDGINSLITAQTKGTDDKINDLKDRLTAIESRSQGVSDSWGWLVGMAGFVLAIVSIFGVITTILNRRPLLIDNGVKPK